MATNKFIKAVLTTGLLAGALDATAASIQFYINTGFGPERVFRYVASAALGKEYVKTQNIYAMAAWGLLFHMIIAMLWALLFFLFFRQIRSVLKNKYVAGIVYALFVWTIMNLVIVPTAFNSPFVFKIKNAAIAAGILIIAIGLPISLMADRYYSKKNSQI